MTPTTKSQYTWRGSFSVGFCMLGKLSRGTNFNDNSDCQRFGQLLWPSSGQVVKKLVKVLVGQIIGVPQKSQSDKNITNCLALAWPRSAAFFLRVVNQQPETSRPASCLRSSSAAVWMWRASFSWSSLGLLAQ